MKVGVIVPQGWTGEYAGWEPQAAWQRTLEIAQRVDALGFDSAWLFDHFHTTPDPTDELTFESFTTLSALAAATRHVRLGHIVSCAAYRNPALQAKMLATMDTLSGGRIDAGIGAGWKAEEWVAYGYPFPPTRERLDRLEEHLEVLTRMLRDPGRSTWRGRYAAIDGAINLPKPVGPLPIMVGGNGRERTWRIAARFADELNLDAMPADELRTDGLADIARRCEEIGRDPASLRVSVHLWWEHLDAAPSRADVLRGYAELGVHRVMTLLRRAVDSPDEVDAFAEDVRAAGAELDAPLATAVGAP
jgi:F420-dependent oxidoreductase-like protein